MKKKIKQQYHLEPEQGLLNDPNGLVYFQGTYYVFFQWNKYEKNHSKKEWGLFTSKNMVSWKFEGSAVIPDQIYDMQGVYSGSGYVIDGKLHLYYTGNSKNDGKRKSSQCLVISENGKQYQKEGVIIETPEDYTQHFRDPKVWRGENNSYFMVVGGQRKNGKGAIALCRSIDGKNWSYSNILGVSQQFEMIECPDLITLDNGYVLLYNPQKRNNEEDMAEFSFSVYKMVEFNENTGNLLERNLDVGYTKLDYGLDFYAPQTFQDSNGRWILFAWMSRMEAEQEKIFAQNEPNIHCLTLPREIHIVGEKLYQSPVKELYELLGCEIPTQNNESAVVKAYPPSRTFYLNITTIEKGKNVDVNFHNGEVNLEYISEENKLLFRRHSWLDETYETTSCNVTKLNEIEVWSDNSSIEIFVNGGEAVFSSRIYPQDFMPEITVTGLAKKTNIKVNEVMGNVIKGGCYYE